MSIKNRWFGRWAVPCQGCGIVPAAAAVMDKLVMKLQSLKTLLPANCTQANLAKLNSYFKEYQQIVESLPPWYQPVKKECEANSVLIERAITHISDASHSPRDTRYYFKYAVQQLGAGLDQLIGAVSDKISRAM